MTDQPAALANLARLNAPALTDEALAALTFHPDAQVRAIARADIRRRAGEQARADSHAFQQRTADEYAAIGPKQASRAEAERLDCGCTEQTADEHAPGCDRNHWPHDECNEPSTDPAECCGAEPGAPCRSWCLNSENDRDPEPEDIIALAIAGADDMTQADMNRARVILADLRAAGFTVEPSADR